jgi:Carboxypeptidase regulatory-like domain/Uncharacterised protein family (UPF0236)
MFLRVLNRFCILCVGTLSVGAAVAGAVSGASWNGTLSDQSGKPVAAAVVKLHSAAEGRDYTATTAPNGRFTFAEIAKGGYEVSVKLADKEWKAGARLDRRKTRQVSWKEARLALAHEPGSVTPIFGATLGCVEEAGESLAVCALEAGAGSQTRIHGVGDGAVWITEQREAQFGTQARYLVDFYHLCDYLSAAGEAIAGNDKPAWMEEKKDWLKDNRWKDVLAALRPCLEPAHLPDPEAPVRACIRYLSNHSNFLDYKGALAAGLPIGSGEIESRHRCVFQNRLKIAGGWWKTENLKKMIALRVLRANGGWADYWNNMHQAAA